MSSPNPFDGSLYDPMNSPSMGLAMGLLSAGGPSRMPVSLGQALAKEMQTSQESAALDRQRQLKLMIALARLQQITQGAAAAPPGADGAKQ